MLAQELDALSQTILETALRLYYRYGRDSIPASALQRESRVRRRSDYAAALAALCVRGYIIRNRSKDTYSLPSL